MLKRVISILLSATVCITSVQFPSIVQGGYEGEEVERNITSQRAVTDVAIYPVPQKQVNVGNAFTITDTVNVVFEAGVDEATKNLTKEILTQGGLTYTVGTAASNDKTNVFVGIKGSAGLVDTYFQKVQYDQTIFTDAKNFDPYVLSLDGSKTPKGTIAVLGKDSDAAFYGLQSLRQLFVEMEEKLLPSNTYEDYADTEFRGFIEGSYGDPWTNDNRKVLMEFGGEYKMNTYIYAPKFEPYHNGKWRDPYPAAELEELRGLVQKGIESKCEFVWAIHPGFSMIKWDDYDNEFAKMKAKFEQLYSIGVRQFAIFFDDGSNPGTKNVVRVLTDAANWAKSKEGVKDIVFCPTAYTVGMANGDKDQIRQASAIDGVQVMSTGEKIIGSVTDKNVTDMKNMMENGKSPYFWLNWPTNDYADKRLLIGKAEILKGTQRLAGLVSNPMLLYPESNKVGLFQVADYAWNVDEFNADTSWRASFHAITPEVEASYYKLAQHNSDPNSSYHGATFEESENIKVELGRFLEGVKAGTATKADGDVLVKEFDEILAALIDFNGNCKNEALVTESAPWFKNLENLCLAGKKAVVAALEMQKESPNSGIIIENGLQAANYYANSLIEKVWDDRKANGKTMLAESGGRRLMPFVSNLVSLTNNKANELLGFEKGERKAIFNFQGFSEKDISKMVDGDDTTVANFQGGIQKAGDWYGIDLGKTKKVTGVRILQGQNNTDHNIYHNAKLQYSKDGKVWTDINATVANAMTLITANELDVEARYVRYYLPDPVYNGKADYWLRIREFTVTDEELVLPMITNTSMDKVTPTYENGITSIKNLNNITLNPGEYVGIQLEDNKLIDGIVYSSSKDNLTLQTSENGVVYTDGNTAKAARYIRVKNTSKNAITFNLTELSVKEQVNTTPSITSNYTGADNAEWNRILDGDWSTYAWTNSIQEVGSHVTYDMGRLQDVQDITLVVDDGTMPEGANDYFRKGDLEVSQDGKTWEVVHSFNGPGRTDNFPSHKVPNYYKTVDNINKKARYVRLIATERADAWLKLFEMTVNQKNGIVTRVHPSISSDNMDEDLKNIYKIADQNLDTIFTPQRDNGEIILQNTSKHHLKEIITIQNSLSISNAKVSVRYQGSKVFQEVGTMDTMVSSFALPTDKAALEVKISWEGGKIPSLYEVNMIEDKTTDIKEGENNPVVIPVESVVLNKNSTTIDIGKKETLKATINPTDATDTTVVWTSSKPQVASVSSTGEITAVAAGEATITATVGGKSATCQVLVLEKVVVDKTALNEKIKEAEVIDENKYTTESVLKMKEALAKAKEISKKEDATQAQVKEVLDELSSALSHLEEKPVPPVVKEGWIKEADGRLRYYKQGKPFAAGWLEERKGTWKYAGKDGYMATKWAKIGGAWYYLGTNGVMKTGWQKVDNVWYYLAPSGKMTTGWQKVSGQWYYLASSGKMTTGWQKVSGQWYYLDNSGKMKTGWQKIKGSWYYLAKSGKMTTGWQKVSGQWYYLNASGKMLTGWVKVGASWYYLKSNGVMATGWTSDGKKTYYLNLTSGAWDGRVK